MGEHIDTPSTSRERLERASSTNPPWSLASKTNPCIDRMCYSITVRMISSFISRALTEYVEQRHSEADGYTSSTGDDGERRDKLHAIESCVLSAIGAGGLSRLVFLCTHNSRRSQLAQVWFAVAAAYYGLHVEAASAGLEVTKVPEQIMRVLRDVGFEVVDVASDDHAEQQHFCDVRFSSTIAPVRLYSKLLGDLTDDVKNRCIIAVCSDADQRCPAGKGKCRIALPYVDPKEADGSDNEEQTYAARCRQIALEAFVVMRSVKERLAKVE